MLILGIESSCDETAASVCEFLENGERRILSNAVASQIEIHRLYGGVVPEIAGRAHSEAICPIVTEALEKAGKTVNDIDVIGVTSTPGLIGALLVGVSFAKSLAYSTGKPLVAVNHIKGHVAANYFCFPDLKPPFLAAVVSGGHTSIIKVNSFTDFERIGRTRDDAAGEAFDKVGRVMGLYYPCGAEMDKLASAGNAKAYKFPSAAIGDDTLDFSFSGLKTAVLNTLNGLSQKGLDYKKEDVAASFTESFTSSVAKKLEEALHRTGLNTLVLAGGVSANSHLRRALEDMCKKNNVRFCCPPLSLCGDNGAMIAAQAYFEYLDGNISGIDLNAQA
ncbi:MAG: tRNA (adenosine(37)-N6)-threonylcarbamoyltransferase complex transferase subunit TsaD [Clostridia bacterium]|nr:tRNA (adenosine(37)-N6)-threonylcarbamoyltransferase complex transferase subunit TsaD [Clostridia bacterium]